MGYLESISLCWGECVYCTGLLHIVPSGEDGPEEAELDVVGQHAVSLGQRQQGLRAGPGGARGVTRVKACLHLVQQARDRNNGKLKLQEN